MDLLETMTEHHIWLVGELVGRAARLDHEVLDRRGRGRVRSGCDRVHLGHRTRVRDEGM